MPFNLKIRIPTMQAISVECAFQGSKVFNKGGPYTDLYNVTSREAKTDERIRNSGDLVAFNFHGDDFPINPKSAFYDWLYIIALFQNPDLADKILKFQGYSDIAFNPVRSFNCQAHSAALFAALKKLGEIESVVKNKDYYLRVVTGMGVQRTEQVFKQLPLLP